MEHGEHNDKQYSWYNTVYHYGEIWIYECKPFHGKNGMVYLIMQYFLGEINNIMIVKLLYYVQMLRSLRVYMYFALHISHPYLNLRHTLE